MLRIACFLMILVCTVATISAQDSTSQRKTIKLGESPESVCRGFGGKLYATLIQGDKAGDGSVVSIDGETVTTFATGLNDPKGMVFVGGFLVVADVKTMWKIDKTGSVTKLVEAKDFPQTIEFLNDVAASKDGQSVYVAEMSDPSPMFASGEERKLWPLSKADELPKKGCVYRVTLEGKVSLAVPAGDTNLRFPNGLAVGGTKEQERLFVADFFTGNIVTYNEGKYRVVAQGPRGLDGLSLNKDAFFASSWTEGVVWQIDRKTKEHKVILSGLKTAADFFYDVKNQQLLVPDMVGGTLEIIGLQ